MKIAVEVSHVSITDAKIHARRIHAAPMQSALLSINEQAVLAFQEWLQVQQLKSDVSDLLPCLVQKIVIVLMVTPALTIIVDLSVPMMQDVSTTNDVIVAHVNRSAEKMTIVEVVKSVKDKSARSVVDQTQDVLIA